MKITYHHQKNTAVWDEDTSHVTGAEYMVERLLDVWEFHMRPVKITETGPDVHPELWTPLGALACGLVAGFKMTTDESDLWKLPKGAVP